MEKERQRKSKEQKKVVHQSPHRTYEKRAPSKPHMIDIFANPVCFISREPKEIMTDIEGGMAALWVCCMCKR